MTVVAIVPVKVNSRRLPNKNLLLLDNKVLLEYVFETLLECETVDEVYCFCSHDGVTQLLPRGVKVLARPEYLDGDEVLGNDLFRYAIERVSADVVVISHVTSPFIKKSSIDQGVRAVLEGTHSCAFSVMPIQKYTWFKSEPLNYCPSDMAQTQDIEPIVYETGGFYAFSKEDYLRCNTRISDKPLFVTVDYREAIDIDNWEDFQLATSLSQVLSDSHPTKSNSLAVRLVGERNIAINHVCFDLDGCLIDSLVVMEKSWEVAMENVGLTIEFQRYKEHVGKPFKSILKELEIDDKHFKDIERAYSKTSSDNVNDIVVYDGVIQCLEKLQDAGVRISIATSKPRKRTLDLLDKLFEGVIFDSVVTPDDVTSGKPFPDQLLKCCTDVGSEPQRSLYVGDMSVDAEAAKRAGFRFIAAAWGYGTLSDSETECANILDVVEVALGLQLPGYAAKP